MTIPAKTGLVNGIVGEFPVSMALEILSLSRSTWYYQAGRVSYAEKYKDLKKPLLQIARSRTEYGYRRATTELRVALDRTVNHKVVQRLHNLWELPLVRGTQVPHLCGVRKIILEAGGRANLVATLEDITPLMVLYTDFTELAYARGKAFLIPLVDHVSKVVAGWALGEEKNTQLALTAWRNARRWLIRNEVPLDGLIVHQDRDPIFTGYGWTGTLLIRDRVRLSYALNGAKDNPEMESFNSRFKSENRSLLLDAGSFDELKSVVARRMSYYNRERRHSTLGNMAPMAWLKENWTRG
jgi:transposase InsO family protein